MTPVSQVAKLYDLLSDDRAHCTDEIARVVYGEKGDICPHCGRGEVKSLARVGARIWDLKHRGHDIRGWHDKERPALYWYRLIRPVVPESPPVPTSLFTDLQAPA